MNTKRTSKAFRVRATMTLLLLLLTSATAWATDGVKYIDGNGENVYKTTATIAENAITDLENGWYVISGNYSSSQTLTFTGDVNLILADDADGTITGANGIVVDGNLTIYGQSEGTGSLTIKTKGNGSTSGDGILAKNGKITINGGILTINADWYGITTTNNDITINGGRITVTATGENGIDATGNITITGGTVTANASKETTYGMTATGNITLGCTKDTDYIIANSYNKDININSGLSPLIVYIDTANPYSQVPTAYNNQATITPSVINNKIIAPDLFGISKGNTGTSDNPYTISTAGGLQLLATYVNSGTIFDYYDKDTQAYDVYTGKYFMTTDDIIFDTTIENNFTPIGDEFHIFQGTFNGGGHIIRGINIYTDKRYVGLFGHLGNENTAMITNVTLANASIIGNNILYTGGIVGHNNGGSISNCLVANSIINGNSYTGAITGLNSGTLYHNYYGNSTINNATNNAGCGISNGHIDVTDNDGAVSATFLSESVEVPSSLTGEVRFYREFTGGSASTICLPFDYTPNGSEGTFYTFKSVEYSEGQYIATMEEANKATSPLSANTPYLFMPAGTETKPVLFHGDAAYASNPLTTSGYWTFKGTYEEKKWDSEPTGIYGFSAQAVADDNISQGQFVKVGAYVKIRPLRAYLEYTGSNFPNTRSSLPEEGLPDRIIVRLVGGGTSIGQLDMKTGQVNLDSGWYNLDGIRLSGKPTKHGIYVHHGKKVVISTMNNE